MMYPELQRSCGHSQEGTDENHSQIIQNSRFPLRDLSNTGQARQPNCVRRRNEHHV